MASADAPRTSKKVPQASANSRRACIHGSSEAQPLSLSRAGRAPRVLFPLRFRAAITWRDCNRECSTSSCRAETLIAFSIGDVEIHSLEGIAGLLRPDTIFCTGTLWILMYRSPHPRASHSRRANGPLVQNYVTPDGGTLSLAFAMGKAGAFTLEIQSALWVRSGPQGPGCGVSASHLRLDTPNVGNHLI